MYSKCEVYILEGVLVCDDTLVSLKEGLGLFHHVVA